MTAVLTEVDRVAWRRRYLHPYVIWADQKLWGDGDVYLGTWMLAMAYREAGLTPDTALAWAKAGVSPADVARWLPLGAPLALVLRLRALGVSVDVVEGWSAEQREVEVALAALLAA